MKGKAMKSKKADAEKTRWDLAIMYQGLDDPRLDADIATLVKKMRDFQAAHKGRLTETLGQAITDYAEITMLEDGIRVYLYLRQSTNVGDAKTKAKMAEVEKNLNKASGEYLEFLKIEIVALDDKTLARFYEKDPLVAKHRPWLEQIRLFKPHLLSEEVESALTKRSAFGESAWGEFYRELEADLEFVFERQKKTLSEMLHILGDSKNAEERAMVMAIVNTGLQGTFAKYSAQTLYMVAGAHGVDETERHYRHPMEFRNKASRLPDKVVEALHNAVRDTAAPLARRYYKLKAAHLGLKTLRWSDRNAPLPFTDTTIVPFDEALTMVTKAYESFSPTLAAIARRLAENKCIDAAAVKGKRGGAFNYSIVLPNGKPASFTFLNYLGSSQDVMMLAHELGHGVHGILAGEAQGALMFRAPIAYCETASIFGEMTTFNFLKRRLSEQGEKKALLALIMQSIDDNLNKTVRQISFSNFERRLHGMDPSYKTWSEPKKLSVPELNKIWLETTQEMYGKDGKVFTYKDMEYLWTYIHHFHSPFYVYGYAFGLLLTSSLYAKRQALGDKFEPLYLEMLRSGSTRDVVELLKPFSLNPAGGEFWTDGINAGLGELVKEAEELSKELGIVGKVGKQKK